MPESRLVGHLAIVNYFLFTGLDLYFYPFWPGSRNRVQGKRDRPKLGPTKLPQFGLELGYRCKVRRLD